MAIEPSHAETRPEERSGDDRADGLALLVTSYGGRSQLDLPDSGALTIGRGRRLARPSGAGESTWSIPDELLSREHLRISRQPRGYVVEDLGSRNGTHLDGRPVAGRARLREGSILLFGNQVAVCRRLSEAARAALRQESETAFGPVATFSPSLALTFARLRRLARTDGDLLLAGEHGVGKEVCAHAVHRASGRRGRCVAVNCSALSPAHFERELEAAQGGTLVLDDAGDMSSDLRARIFRFLRDRTILRLGSTKSRRIDVRVIAVDTHAEPGGGRQDMRAELAARMGGDPTVIPPLRERPEDVAGLLAHFAGGQIDEVAPAALRALCLYSWPLNVRELANATRNAIALTEDGELRLEHLPAAVRGVLDRGPVVTARRRSPRAAPERAELEQLLRLHKGNVSNVARALDRKWPVVWRWLVRFGLRSDSFRKPQR